MNPSDLDNVLKNQGIFIDSRTRKKLKKLVAKGVVENEEFLIAAWCWQNGGISEQLKADLEYVKEIFASRLIGRNIDDNELVKIINIAGINDRIFLSKEIEKLISCPYWVRDLAGGRIKAFGVINSEKIRKALSIGWKQKKDQNRVVTFILSNMDKIRKLEEDFKNGSLSGDRVRKYIGLSTFLWRDQREFTDSSISDSDFLNHFEIKEGDITEIVGRLAQCLPFPGLEYASRVSIEKLVSENRLFIFSKEEWQTISKKYLKNTNALNKICKSQGLVAADAYLPDDFLFKIYKGQTKEILQLRKLATTSFVNDFVEKYPNLASWMKASEENPSETKESISIRTPWLKGSSWHSAMEVHLNERWDDVNGSLGYLAYPDEQIAEKKSRVRAKEDARRNWIKTLVRGEEASAITGLDEAVFLDAVNEGVIPVAIEQSSGKRGRNRVVRQYDPAVLGEISKEIENFGKKRNLEDNELRKSQIVETKEIWNIKKIFEDSEIDVRTITRSDHGYDASVDISVTFFEYDFLLNTSIPISRDTLHSRTGLTEFISDFLNNSRLTGEKELERSLAGFLAVTDGKNLDNAKALKRFFRLELQRGSIPFGGIAQRLDQAYSHYLSWIQTDILKKKTGLNKYLNFFPRARAIKRKFILHLGPTNSGKTHEAMNTLASSKKGLFLAPLRLLAAEGAEALRERNIPCSMITGEELDIDENASHVSATVEMMNPDESWDVVVIDEIQNILDENRGWAWTQAVAGAAAPMVILCGAEDGLPVVEHISALTGEEVEIRVFERKNTLVPLLDPVTSPEKGDVVVAFSRKRVLELKEEYESSGYKVAALYGNLSPEVRRAQMKIFNEGEVDILVATDAIGQGLNCIARRVLFSETSKFDGTKFRELNRQEVLQIAGRAGRFGKHENGQSGILLGEYAELRTFKNAFETSPEYPEDTRPWITPPFEAIKRLSEEINNENLSELIIKIRRDLLSDDPEFRASGMEEAERIAAWTNDFKNLDLFTRFRYTGTPITGKDEVVEALLRNWMSCHNEGNIADFPVNEIDLTGLHDSFKLLEVEQWSQRIVVYLWLSMRWPEVYTMRTEVQRYREFIDEAIANELATRRKRKKYRKRNRRD